MTDPAPPAWVSKRDGRLVPFEADRICQALSNPHMTMLGHATGRLLLRRDGYRVDLERVIKTAAKNGKAGTFLIDALLRRRDVERIQSEAATAGFPAA